MNIVVWKEEVVYYTVVLFLLLTTTTHFFIYVTDNFILSKLLGEIRKQALRPFFCDTTVGKVQLVRLSKKSDLIIFYIIVITTNI